MIIVCFNVDLLKICYEKIEFLKIVENFRVLVGKDIEGLGYNYCIVLYKCLLNENRKKNN